MDQAESPSPPPRGRRTLALLVAGALLLVGGFAAGRVTAPQVGTPGSTSVEAGFARDMQVHHQQAVVMAMMVRDLTTDPDIRALAYDIALGQSQGAGELYGFLVDWNLPQASPEPAMTWMTLPALDGDGHDGEGHDGAGHDGTGLDHGGAASAHVPGGAMPGFATEAQLARLGTLRGVAAERDFLTLMIAHHEGGIEMAKALLDRSDYPSTATFARSLISVQTSEITNMRAMLKARGGA